VKFLEKRGPGLHHIAIEVEGIESALAFLKGLGVPLIDETPRVGRAGTRWRSSTPRRPGASWSSWWSRRTGETFRAWISIALLFSPLSVLYLCLGSL